MEVKLKDLEVGDQYIAYDIYWEVLSVREEMGPDGKKQIHAPSREIRNQGPRQNDRIYGDPDSTVKILPRGYPTLSPR